MIIGLAVVMIAGLLLAVGWWCECEKTKELSDQLYQEKTTSSNLRNEKHHAWERANVLEEQVKALKQDIADLKAPFKDLIAEQEEELGFGHHVKWRSLRKPTALTYQMLFDMDVNGQRILEELTTRFKRNIFAENERETCRRLGRAEVVDFIINRINTANDPRYDESKELDYMEKNDE